MSTLHLVFSPAGLQSCQAVCGEDDAIVLLGDAVFALAPDLARLVDDCTLRGLPPSEHDISMNDVVKLCSAHSPVVSWSS